MIYGIESLSQVNSDKAGIYILETLS